MTMVEQVYQTQNLSYTQRKGAIRLILKKKTDITYEIIDLCH